MSETKVVLAVAPSSEPTKIQFLRPTASFRRFRSEMLLVIGSRPAVVEEALEGSALIDGVADGRGDGGIVEHDVALDLAPRRARAEAS
jgi:hypothetical protein